MSTNNVYIEERSDEEIEAMLRDMTRRFQQRPRLYASTYRLAVLYAAKRLGTKRMQEIVTEEVRRD